MKLCEAKIGTPVRCALIGIGHVVGFGMNSTNDRVIIVQFSANTRSTEESRLKEVLPTFKVLSVHPNNLEVLDESEG